MLQLRTTLILLVVFLRFLFVAVALGLKSAYFFVGFYFGLLLAFRKRQIHRKIKRF